jgi:hypothetical protein
MFWVRLYTLGSEVGAGDDRRAEIESDLWEHRNHAAAEGERSAVVSLSILGRWAAGIPADLSWRASQLRHSGRATKESIMTNILGRYWWQTLAVLTAIATIYAGIRQFFTDEVSVGVSAGKIIALVFLVAAGVLTLLGLAVHRTRPRRGSMMVMIGVLPGALVGLFGIGIIIGLIASLARGESWWWLPVGVTSAVATASGVGAFGAWWHAETTSGTTNRHIPLLPAAVVLGGLVSAGAGVTMGMMPLLIIGAVACLIGISIWSRRTNLAP